MPGLSRAGRLHQQSWHMRDIRSAEMPVLGYSCVITELECTVYTFHGHSSEHRNVYTINGTCPSMEQFSCCDSWWAKFKVCTCLIQFNTFQGELTGEKKPSSRIYIYAEFENIFLLLNLYLAGFEVTLFFFSSKNLGILGMISFITIYNMHENKAASFTLCYL